jgi:hypothetical protein
MDMECFLLYFHFLSAVFFFQCTSITSFLVKFIPKYFILIDIIFNGIVFFNLLFRHSLLMSLLWPKYCCSFRIHMLKLNPQGGSIKRRDLWEVVWLWHCALIDGFGALREGFMGMNYPIHPSTYTVTWCPVFCFLFWIFSLSGCLNPWIWNPDKEGPLHYMFFCNIINITVF